MDTEKGKYCLKGQSDNGQVEDLLKDKNDQESRQRLQALIAEWLRMENLVVLTAAGVRLVVVERLLFRWKKLF
jgi:hypothetical protein